MNKTGKNLTDLLDSNRSQLLYYIVKHPGCSRAELGAATGLTLASITKTMRPLVDSGIVYETGYAEGKKGRRSVGLSFSYDKFKILGVKLSWNGLDIQPYDFHGKAYGQPLTVPFKNISADNINEVMKAAADGIHHFCRKYPEISAIGMAVPGPYYRDTGSILLPPYAKDPAKRYYFPLKEKLSQITELPIFIEHDADAGALAYWWFRTNGDNDYVIMNIFADDGLGIGLTDGRKVFTGTSNCSCEMGHITIDYNGRPCSHCGSNGCINAYCSGRSLEEIAKENLSMHPESMLNSSQNLSCQEIFQSAEKGDTFAASLLYECGTYLGHGIISLLHVFNPDLIIISGMISEAGSSLSDGIQDTLVKRQSAYTVIPEIKLLRNEKKLPLLGAAAFAMDRMLNAPTKYFSLSSNN